MFLNKFGAIVKDEWLKTIQLRKNVKLDEYIIMPNHFHGVIILVDINNQKDAARRVSTGRKGYIKSFCKYL